MSLGCVDSANPWLLPRIPLYPQNSRKFVQLKVLLKCGMLCPENQPVQVAEAELIRVPANPSGD